MSDASWDEPPNADAPPILSVAGFEGPLDWLLELVRARRIDFAGLSIGALIGAFADALEEALAARGPAPAPLDRWGDWLVMAATLTLLRSRLLLPAGAPEAAEALDEAETLRRQLVSRAAMQAAAAWLDQRPQLGRDCFVRGAPEARAGDRVGDITALLRACLAALQLPQAAETLYRPLPPPLWQVPDAILRIKGMLGGLPDYALMQMLLPGVARDAPERDLRCRSAVASTLLACLELSRTAELELAQPAPWADLIVAKACSLEVPSPET